MSNSDVTNPGSVNVANQGDGLLSVDQPVTISPSNSAGSATPAIAGGSLGAVNNKTVTNPGTTNVANEAFGKGLPVNVNVH
jgi:hypothetical protein